MRKCRKKWNGIRFAAIDHPVLDSAAFKALSGHAKAVVLLLQRRWSGRTDNNNGRIPLSTREVKTWCHISNDKARAVLREVEASRIAIPTQRGGFTWKRRHATVWELTYRPTAQREPSWAFKKSESKGRNPEHGTHSGCSAAPTMGADDSARRPRTPESVPTLGADSASHGTHYGCTSKVPSPAPPEGAPRPHISQGPRPEGRVAESAEGRPVSGMAQAASKDGEIASGERSREILEATQIGAAEARPVKPPTKSNGRSGWCGPRGAGCWPGPQRRALGLTQEQLAALSGVQRPYIATIERGKRNPGPEIRARIETALSARAS